MPSPIVPTFRITFPMVSDGFPHVIHVYLDTNPSGDPSGFDTVGAHGLGNVGVSTVLAPFWNMLAPIFSAAGTVFGNAHLDRFLTPNWVPQFTEVNAVVPSGFGIVRHSHQRVWSGYDTLHKKVKYFVEEDAFIDVQRQISYAAMNTTDQLAMDRFFNLNGGAFATSPYAWARSRAGNPLGAFTSVVWSYSKHWRRKRGLG